MSKVKTEIQIEEKLKELTTQSSYLEEFLSSIYKGSDAKEKIGREMIALKREINILTWVLNDDLPF